MSHILGAAMAQQDQQRHTDGCSVGCGTVGYTDSNQQRPTITLPLEIQADLPFPAAIGAALRGHRITRRGWNAGGQWVQAQRPDKGSKMSHPYMYLKNSNHELVPWVPSQGDLFAQDWAVIPTQPVYGG